MLDAKRRDEISYEEMLELAALVQSDAKPRRQFAQKFDVVFDPFRFNNNTGTIVKEEPPPWKMSS